MASAATSTMVSCEPTASSTRSVVVFETAISMSSIFLEAKPALLTLSEYLPTGSSVKLKSPVPVVVEFSTVPVAGLVRTTLTFVSFGSDIGQRSSTFCSDKIKEDFVRMLRHLPVEIGF